MVSTVQNVAIDCADAYGPAKNRLHLCLRPETTREAEVTRLLALGATRLADHRNPDGSEWAVLTDPEGNEFCVLRSTSDRSSTPS